MKVVFTPTYRLMNFPVLRYKGEEFMMGEAKEVSEAVGREMLKAFPKNVKALPMRTKKAPARKKVAKKKVSKKR